MTKEELADLFHRSGIISGYAAGPVLGFSRRTVQSWLNGDRIMTPQTAELVCIALIAEKRIAPGEWMKKWVRPSIIDALNKAF